MAIFAVHFVYRWLVVTNHRLLRSFQNWKICLWFSILLLYGTTWICTGYFLSAPSESTTNYIKDSVKKMFELEFDEYIYLGPFLYEVLSDGSLDFHMNGFITVGVITVTIVTSVIIVLVFGYLCYAKINRLVATTNDSLKFKRLQKQLFYSLVIQTLTPFLLRGTISKVETSTGTKTKTYFDSNDCLIVYTHRLFLLMHIPGGIMTAFVVFDIDLSVYSAVLSMTIAIYPAVDPIPTLVIVESYRKTLLRLFGISKKIYPIRSTIVESSKLPTS